MLTNEEKENASYYATINLCLAILDEGEIRRTNKPKGKQIIDYMYRTCYKNTTKQFWKVYSKANKQYIVVFNSYSMNTLCKYFCNFILNYTPTSFPDASHEWNIVNKLPKEYQKCMVLELAYKELSDFQIAEINATADKFKTKKEEEYANKKRKNKK